MYKYTEKTLGECIEGYIGRDSWGVDYIYVHTLCEILEAYGVSLDRKRDA